MGGAGAAYDIRQCGERKSTMERASDSLRGVPRNVTADGLRDWIGRQPEGPGTRDLYAASERLRSQAPALEQMVSQ